MLQEVGSKLKGDHVRKTEIISDVLCQYLYRFTIGKPQIKIEEEEFIAMIWPGFSS
jgi:hypothetical protein